jgi:thiol-disulfide isomerase/thioredoxin
MSLTTQQLFSQNLTGTWRVSLETPGGALPFLMEIYLAGDTLMSDIINGEEHLSTSDITQQDDLYIIQSSIFHSRLEGRLRADGRFSGYWYDLSRGPDYRLPFSAEHEVYHRFYTEPEEAEVDLSGSWETIFTTADGDTTLAVGLFMQENDHLTGTFLTATGDYRFLEGQVSGEQFQLSAFDGAHAFLFKGSAKSDQLSGTFYSGNHWQETFTATRNPGFQLSDSTSVPQLKEGVPISFCFPEPGGDLVCLEDDRFRNKVVIVQIIGTWCPNCMDESAYLKQVYDAYHLDGLEIVALAFERETDTLVAKSNFDRLRHRFGIEYPILLAGSSSKKDASAALPMLDYVFAYPTTLVLSQDHEVVLIHSGFNGPATGQLYLEFKKAFEELLQHLLY